LWNSAVTLTPKDKTLNPNLTLKCAHVKEKRGHSMGKYQILQGTTGFKDKINQQLLSLQLSFSQ
jgi:hypothetical protein